jgi:DNA mismatch repair protein MutL
MPNRIRVLPDEIANRIAAGEVVERPASVVKELVENAIDAGADRIVVEVAAGGKETIRVSDNGCGMCRDDALLALERHATSKICDLSDLRTLRTLGFRGEALPSIAAVSRMVLETRLEEDEEATRIVVEGGRVRDMTSAGRGRGTTVTVHGLFFNVPARRKFLKGTDTELRHTVNAVTGLALAYAEIAFVFSHNGREMLNLDRADRKRRIESVFGVYLGGDAIFVEGGAEGIRVWGFVGRPETACKSGAQQALVVNGRWVQHKAMTYAIYDGYGGLLARGLYPTFSIFLEVDPTRLDVNVHPSKREVRFADERTVYRTLAEAVRTAIREVDLIPDMGPGNFEPISTFSGTASSSPKASVHPPEMMPGRAPELVAERPAEERRQAYLTDPLGLDRDPQMALPLTVRKPAVEGVQPARALPEEDLIEENPAQVSVWQLHQRYILAHIKNGVIIIDQHVAHERILYEQVLEHFHGTPGTGQRLLFPLTLDFGLAEIQAVREAMPLLEKMGFGVRDFGGNTVVVDAIPVDLKAWEEGKLLREIVRDLEGRFSASPGQDRQISPLEHRLAASYAAHTSVRSGDALSTREMQGLIDRLFATREPFVGPQGRPIVVKMSLDEIDQHFRR